MKSGFDIPHTGFLLDRRPRDECGIFAVYGHEEAAKLTYFGLYALQHRGQESAGIVTSDGKQVFEHKAMGLVPEIFDEETLNKLKGDMALGHVRYSTTGSSLLVNAQPFSIHYSGKTFAIGHFTFDDAIESIILLGFCRKPQIFNGFNRCLPGLVHRGFIVSFEIPFYVKISAGAHRRGGGSDNRPFARTATQTD